MIMVMMMTTVPPMNLFLLNPVVSLSLAACDSIPDELQAVAHMEAVVVFISDMLRVVKSSKKISLSLACHILRRTFCKQKPNVIIEL